MVKVNFVGDVALFKRYEEQGIDPIDRVEMPVANLNVANLEFPLPSDSDINHFYDVDPNFRISDSFSRSIKLNKFDLYGLANNHVMDYGPPGVHSTIDKLGKAGASHFGVGRSGFNTATKTIQNIRFLFVAVVKSGRWNRKSAEIGPDQYKIETLINFLSEATKIYDHAIVFPHWGTELVDGPDCEDVINARRMIDAGASCVVGHHPHVTQGIEEYNGGLIAYSLGSFIYLPNEEGGNFSKPSARNISLCLSVQFSKNRVLDHTPYKYVLNHELMIPTNHGDYRNDREFFRLCSVIGNRSYYSKQVRKVLLLRELILFKDRFKRNPIAATIFYLRYIKFKHFKKVLGIS